MASVDTDWNLLFGALARHMGYVSSEALIAALNAWASDPDRSLGSLLVEQGVLNESDRSRLATLVDQRVAGLLGEGQTTLALDAGTLPTTVRELDDPEGPATIPNRDDPGHSTSSASTTPGVAQDRFRVLRSHARGGVGEVFVALDRELRREVALKEIQRERADDPQCRRRFVREAEITGRLEHPGIVPVYGLGSRHDGRPYYAMRLIRGESLKDAIQRFHREHPAGHSRRGLRSLEFRKLLSQFLNVCNAVAYAHSQGVLHRDLKPSNIMLGPYGETLIVDWGLAKTFGRTEAADNGLDTAGSVTSEGSGSQDQAPTQFGAAIGTPAYMSPEQAAGRLDQIGPASDIYGLGATLYNLLTGQPPVQGGELLTILAKVRRGDIPPPRQGRRDVPRGLEAVCQKAMALDPTNRYPSARALADDLEHWLADEPVSAWHEPLTVRLARWSRHHRSLTAALLVSLVTALLALSVGTWLIDQQKAEAMRQRDRAERNLIHARQLVENLYVRTARTLADHRQMDAEQQEILEHALRFYEAFALPQSQEPEVRWEAARAALRVADIRARLGQLADAEQAYRDAQDFLETLVAEYPGDPRYLNTLIGVLHGQALIDQYSGRLDQAETAFRRAVALAEHIVARFPASVDYQDNLARSLLWQGILDVAQGRFDPAEDAFHRAEQLWEDLARRHPDDLDYPRSLASVANHLSGLYLAIGRVTQAQQAMDRMGRQMDHLANNLAHVADFQFDLAENHIRLGNLARDHNRPDEAQAAYQQALHISRHLVTDYPHVSGYRDLMARSHADLGNLWLTQGQFARAEEALVEALSLRERLSADFPEFVNYHERLASVFSNLGILYNATVRPDAAQAAYRQAIVINERLVANHPRVLSYHNSLAQSLFTVGHLEWGLGHVAQAEQSYRRAVALWEQLADEYPRLTRYQLDRVRGLNNLGLLLLNTNRPTQAEEVYQRAVALGRSLADVHPQLTDARYELARTLTNLGVLLLSRDRLEQAELSLDQASQIHRGLLDEYPGHGPYHNALAQTCQQLGYLHTRAGRPDQARAFHGQALALREQLVADHPERADYRRELAASYLALGTLERTLRRVPEAREALGQALAIYEALVASEPMSTPSRRGLALANLELGHTQELDGRLDEAIACFQRAIALLDQLVRDDTMTLSQQRELASALHFLGSAQHRTRRTAQAISTLERAVALRRQLADQAPGDLDLVRDWARSLTSLGVVQVQTGHRAAARHGYETALALWERLVGSTATDADLQGFAAGLQSFTDLLRREGQIAEARATLDRAVATLQARPEPSSEALFTLAVLQARASSLQTDDPDPGASDRSAAPADQVVATLRRAVAAGLRDPARVRTHPDLTPLLRRDDVQLLLLDMTLPDDPFQP